MNIIESQNVDLISPFPSQEIKRAFGWNHCYRTIIETDDSPQTIEEFTPHLQQLIQMCPSWGIVDKNHLTNVKHEAPLVGIVVFEPSNARHGYVHVASARRAWKSGLVDEAMKVVIGQLFDQIPTLLRVGACMSERNYPAKALCRRLNMRYEGLFEEMVVKNAIAENVVFFGLTKSKYIQNCQVPVTDESVQQLDVIEEN